MPESISPHILVVDDDPQIRALLQAADDSRCQQGQPAVPVVMLDEVAVVVNAGDYQRY